MKNIKALSRRLDVMAIAHQVVIASNHFEDDFARLLYSCTDDADDELGDSDDFGWFLYFEFKANGFAKWLKSQEKNFNKYGLTSKEMGHKYEEIKKHIGDIDKPFVIILSEDTDNKVSTKVFPLVAGKAEWAKLTAQYDAFDAMNDSEEDEEYDPETDELED